ncbi:T9SS type A sorting domain-containing protein [Chryseobacterium sp. MMS23-Vi53]|uniref:T9SS type A sorting domain-containing protein n=1 Tax=Chryseobacterium sp. MMS23-Vi53 TaxID=3386644 RepID=UPI0039EA739B
MKKAIFFATLFGVSQLCAQTTTIFYEDFGSTASADLLPNNWTAQDLDGDESTWIANVSGPMFDAMGYSGQFCYSYGDDPDNLLISPAITLPAGNPLALTFLIGTYTGNGLLTANGHYAVYVLPSNIAFTGTPTPLLEESIGTGDTALQKTINLSSFAGQTVRLYFKHFNSPSTFLLLDSVKIAQTSTLGTSEVKSNAQVGIYPNPTTDYLNIKSNYKILNAVIFDAAGRKINAQLSDNKINVQNLQTGSYIIEIETKEGISSQKFIKK